MANRKDVPEPVKDLNVGVLLLSVLRNSNGRPKNPPRHRFHRFIDDLCWLSNLDAALNAISIAIQAEPGMHTFWITGNHTPAKPTVDHLEWLLATLRDTPAQELEAKIFNTSADKAFRQVKKYVRQLDHFVRRLLSSNAMALPSVATPVNAIHRLILDSASYTKLSAAAYAFREDRSYQSLKIAINNHPDLEDLQLLRHYLGRVASWAKAAKFVAKMASFVRPLLQSHRVCTLPGQSTSPMMFPPDTTIGVALKKLMGSEIISDGHSFANTRLVDAFENLYKSRDLSCQVHAETAMHVHFHANNMSFFNGDPYIGCSKPSCYACDLFRDCHPMHVHPRPCSGNVWARWTPLSSEQMNEVGLDGTTKAAVEKMTDSIRRTIGQNACGGLRAPGRTIDSWTDFSSSLPAVSSRA